MSEPEVKFLEDGGVEVRRRVAGGVSIQEFTAECVAAVRAIVRDEQERQRKASTWIVTSTLQDDTLTVRNEGDETAYWGGSIESYAHQWADAFAKMEEPQPLSVTMHPGSEYLVTSSMLKDSVAASFIDEAMSKELPAGLMPVTKEAAEALQQIATFTYDAEPKKIQFREFL